MKILHLTLKKRWFDVVGINKHEEYREVKQFWAVRLLHGFSKQDIHFTLDSLKCPYETINGDTFFDAIKKDFDVVCFKNGYGKNAPVKQFKFKGLELRTGNPDWGAEPGQEYFVIKLGDLLTPPSIQTKNDHQ